MVLAAARCAGVLCALLRCVSLLLAELVVVVGADWLNADAQVALNPHTSPIAKTQDAFIRPTMPLNSSDFLLLFRPLAARAVLNRALFEPFPFFRIRNRSAETVLRRAGPLSFYDARATRRAA